MNRLPIAEQERAVREVAVLWLVRNVERRSDEQVAARLGYGSVEAMLIQHRQWGFPSWLVGEGPTQPSSAQRRARGGKGSTQELPPASQAAEAFKEVISELDTAVDTLQFVKQWLKDGRFTTEAIYTKESAAANWVYKREDFRDPGGEVGLYWEYVCEEHGQDPAVQEFKVPTDKTQYGGADWYPHEVLTKLIGSYALSGRPLEPLLEKLHPDHTSEDRVATDKKREELLHKARQLAAMVRGNRQAVKQGPKPESVTPKEQSDASWNPISLRKLGLDEAEIERLAGLRLPHHKRKP